MYDPGTARWMSMDPMGFEADGPNRYAYANNNPTNAIDPSGLKLVDTCAKRCAGWQRGTIWDVVVSHHFIDVEGVGYGFFERDLNACGTGQWRKDDLKTYPPTDDPSKIPQGQFYSTCKQIQVEDDCFDPVKFCDALKACIAKAQANPGEYCVITRNCGTEVDRCIREALEASLKVTGVWATYCKGQSGFFPIQAIPPGNYGPPPWMR